VDNRIQTEKKKSAQGKKTRYFQRVRQDLDELMDANVRGRTPEKEKNNFFPDLSDLGTVSRRKVKGDRVT